MFFCGTGDGLRLQTPRRSWKLVVLVTCIFLGGVASAASPPLRRPSHMFFGCFVADKAGEGFDPNPERKPCPPTLGDTKGARNGKRDKGEGLRPQTSRRTKKFFFSFCSFSFFFVSGAIQFSIDM